MKNMFLNTSICPSCGYWDFKDDIDEYPEFSIEEIDCFKTRVDLLNNYLGFDEKHNGVEEYYWAMQHGDKVYYSKSRNEKAKKVIYKYEKVDKKYMWRYCCCPVCLDNYLILLRYILGFEYIEGDEKSIISGNWHIAGLINSDMIDLTNKTRLKYRKNHYNWDEKKSKKIYKKHMINFGKIVRKELNADSFKKEEINKKNEKIVNKYFDCICKDPEHSLCFSYFKNIKDDSVIDKEIFCSIFLSNGSFLFRLCNSVKYIFGYRSRYGHFGNWILCNEDVVKLKNLLNKIDDDYE
jgi:uncharacterized DUF497 family protein